MSSLFGSSYHREHEVEIRRRDIDAAEAPRLREEVRSLRQQLGGAVSLTPEEIRGLRMALRFGVPDPEPDEIRSARVKLEAAEHAALGGRYDRITPPSPDTEDTEDTGKTRETP